jgi:hypothetical protein
LVSSSEDAALRGFDAEHRKIIAGDELGKRLLRCAAGDDADRVRERVARHVRQELVSLPHVLQIQIGHRVQVAEPADVRLVGCVDGDEIRRPVDRQRSEEGRVQ